LCYCPAHCPVNNRVGTHLLADIAFGLLRP